MARGQNASTGRSARSEGVPNIGKMSTSDAEAYLLKNANRGYPANKDDILAQYGEEAYESRANGLRAPSYGQWLQQQVNRRERTKARENSRERLLATPEGKKIEADFVRAKNFYNEASAETNKARDELEVAFRKEYGQPMADYMDKASNRGRSMDEIDASIKAIVPEAYAKVDRLLATENALQAEYDKKEKARQAFFNP
jgi:hypothetical protein